MPISQKSSTRNSHPKSHNRTALLLMAVAAAAAVLLSLCCGSQPYSLQQMIFAVSHRDTDSTVWQVLVNVRVPRTLAAGLAGCALAVAGAVIQAVLNNAMASPNVIGINAGAGFFGLLAAVFAPPAMGLVPISSFLGAFCTALFIYALAVRAAFSRTVLILAGIAVGSMLTAGINTITLLEPNAVASSSSFMLGGFSGVALENVQSAFFYILVGLLLAGFLAENLDVLQLGEESAASLGLNVQRTRFLAILAAALLAGAAVSFAGLLSFVGLLVPHIVRRLVGGRNVWVLPACALSGTAFVLLCDTLARVIFAPFEFPVGIILSLLGGPFFLSLLLRHRKGRLYD